MRPPRVGAGTPQGGQFATGPRSEPAVRLNLPQVPSRGEVEADAILIGSLGRYQALGRRAQTKRSAALAAHFAGDLAAREHARDEVAFCEQEMARTAPHVASLTADLAQFCGPGAMLPVAERETVRLRALLAEADPKGHDLVPVLALGHHDDPETHLIWGRVAMVGASVENDDGSIDLRVLCLDRQRLGVELGRVTVRGPDEHGDEVSREHVIDHLLELSEHGGVRQDVTFARSLRARLEQQYYGGQPPVPHIYRS